jgi:hypothetical protein
MPRPRRNTDQAELIELAIAGIDAQIRELQLKKVALQTRVRVGARIAVRALAAGAEPKRVFSAATKRRLSLAAKRRWARERAAKKGKGA